jgi:uncharacterized protein (DUF2126 family)
MAKLSTYATRSPVAGDYLSGVGDPAGTPATVNYEFQALRNAIVVAGVNAQTGTTYTLALTDQGDLVTMNNASANTLTIPTNASVAFPTGTIVNVAQIGAGATTVEGDTGVTLNGVSAGGAALNEQYSQVSLVKIGTDAWLIAGAHGAVA